MTSGSLQALDLVNATLLSRGDTVLFEQESYEGSINRMKRLGVNMVGIPLDRDGMRTDAVASALANLKSKRHPAEIHLHHPDGAEPDRHHHAGKPPGRAVAALRGIRRADLRGRLLRRPDLGPQAAARDLRHEQAWRRHPYRLVLQVDRAGAARRLHRRAVGIHVAHAGAQDRRRLRRAGADGAGGVLHAAFHRACAGAAPARCAASSIH